MLKKMTGYFICTNVKGILIRYMHKQVLRQGPGLYNHNIKFLEQCGLLKALYLERIMIPHEKMTKICYYWDLTRHTFLTPFGEMGPVLEDVHHITGLLIVGREAYMMEPRKMT